MYDIARNAGLNMDAANGVFNAAMVAVAEHMPNFKYDPEIGSFKSWLHQLIRLQIISRTLKRRPSSNAPAREAAAADADPSGKALDQIWDAEWKANLLKVAIANVKRRLDPRQFQIYDLQVNKQWDAEKVSAVMNLPITEATAAKQNIVEMIQAEVKRLEEKMI